MDTVKKISEGLLIGPEFDFSAVGECSGEVIMPDYYPEIRRVVSVSAEALPDSKFISDKSLEYGGTVSFNVLYIGDDGALSCVSDSPEYSFTQSLPASVSGAAVWVETRAENPQCRVLAPRKLSLRARLRSRICADGGAPYQFGATDRLGEPCGEDMADTLEKHCSEAVTAIRRHTAYTGSTSGSIGISSEAKPVLCDGSVTVTGAEAHGDRISLSGFVSVHIVTLDGTGIYSYTRTRLPFEEDIPADGAAEGDNAAAWGRAASVSINQGDSGFEADVEYDLDIFWCRPCPVTLTDDAYSTEYVTEVRRTETDILSPLCCCTGEVSITGEGKRSGSREADAYIVDAAAFPDFEKAECRDGKLVFSGNCVFKVYVASGGEVECEEFSLPLKYETAAKGDAAPSECVWRAHPSVEDVKARLDGERINVAADMSVFAEAVRKEKREPVTEAVLGDRREDRGQECIRICYPRQGETVWEVAKRCGASLSELERINRISGDGVCDGSPIIIK